MAAKVMQGSSCCGTHVQVTHLCFGAQTKVEMAGEDSSNKRLNGFRHEELFMQERLSRLALLRDSKNREIEFSEKQVMGKGNLDSSAYFSLSHKADQ